MKLIEKIFQGIQPYTLHPNDYQMVVGFQNSNLKIHDQGNYFENNFTLLMVSPQWKKELPNSDKIGHYMALQRALLCLIASQGSFFRDDERIGPIDPNFKVFRPILNLSNYQTMVLDNFNQTSDFLSDQNFIENFISWINHATWEKDFPSYKFLHDILVKIFNRNYGLATKATSPHKKVLETFTARFMRDVEYIHILFENFLKIKSAIEDKIFKNQFDICEIQYGFLWKQIGPKWFLDVKILFTIRQFDTRNLLLDLLTKEFKTKRGLLHSRTFKTQRLNLTGISQISSSTPSTQAGSEKLFDSLPGSKKSPDFDSEDDEDFISNFKANRKSDDDRAPSNPCSFDNLSPTQDDKGNFNPNSNSNKESLDSLEAFFNEKSPEISRKRENPSKKSSSEESVKTKRPKLSAIKNLRLEDKPSSSRRLSSRIKKSKNNSENIPKNQ